MATTYDPTLPDPKDHVRLVLGDTGVDGNSWLLTDEEIAATLIRLPYNETCATLAEGLAARFAQFPDEEDTVSGAKLKWSERVKTWLEIAKRMRAEAANPTADAPKRTMARLGNLTNPVDNSASGVPFLRN